MKNGCNKMGRVWGHITRDKYHFIPKILSRKALSKRQYTDKKENKIFLIYKESQMGSGAKSCAPDPSEFPNL
jgi:hypothetical protein